MWDFISSVVGGLFRFVGKVLFGSIFFIPFFGGGALALGGFYFGYPLVGLVGLGLIVLVLGVFALFGQLLVR
jgi:hypothetical protein